MEPHIKSNLDQVNLFMEENYDLVQRMQPLKAQIKELQTFRLHSLGKTSVGQSILQSQPAEKLEESYKPQLNVDPDMFKKHQVQLQEQLREFGISREILTFEDRTAAYEELKRQKQLQQQRNSQRVAAEELQPRPLISDFSKARKIYENIPRPQSKKQLLQTSEELQMQNCTFQPAVEVFSPTKFNQSPVYAKSFAKTVARLRQAREDRERLQLQKDQRGAVDPKLMEQLQKPLTAAEIRLRERFDQNYQVRRKKFLKQKEVQVAGRLATVKWYEGDTVGEHVESLARLFSLKFDQKCRLEADLQREFGELTVQSVVERKSAVYSVKRSDYVAEENFGEEEFDPFGGQNKVAVAVEDYDPFY